MERRKQQLLILYNQKQFLRFTFIRISNHLPLNKQNKSFFEIFEKKKNLTIVSITISVLRKNRFFLLCDSKTLSCVLLFHSFSQCQDSNGLNIPCKNQINCKISNVV